MGREGEGLLLKYIDLVCMRPTFNAWDGAKATHLNMHMTLVWYYFTPV